VSTPYNERLLCNSTIVEHLISCVVQQMLVIFNQCEVIPCEI